MVSADTIILRPDGVGTYTEYPTAVPAVAHYLNVDEVTSDGDTTYIYMNVTAGDYTVDGSYVYPPGDTFQLQNPAAHYGEITGITTTTAFAFRRSKYGSETSVGMKTGGQYVINGVRYRHSIYGSETPYLGDYNKNSLLPVDPYDTGKYTTSPATFDQLTYNINNGKKFTWQDIESLESGFVGGCFVDAAYTHGEFRVSQVYTTVEYDPTIPVRPLDIANSTTKALPTSYINFSWSEGSINTDSYNISITNTSGTTWFNGTTDTHLNYSVSTLNDLNTAIVYAYNLSNNELSSEYATDSATISNNPPTTPTLISPSNLSTETSSPVILSVSSTDADGDNITYYFYGGTSPTSMSFLGNNDSAGGNSFNWSIYQYDVYYWTAFAGDGYTNSSNMTTAQFTAIVPPQTTINLLNNTDFEDWSAGPATAPDNWTLSGAGASVARESAIVYNGTYSVKITRSGTDCLLYQQLDLPSLYSGKTLNMGGWVYASEPGSTRFIIHDGVNYFISPTHSGVPGWEFLECYGVITQNPASINQWLWLGNVDTDVYYDDVVFVEGYEAAILSSPSNGSTVYTTYPPLTYDVTFDWQDVGAPQYRQTIATDSNFNVIFSDTWLSAHSSTQSLIVNDQYWWRVYAYDGSTYSDSSDIWNFNLTGNSTLSGSAIEGVVYADIDGTYTALSSAEVTIWNTTWSDTAVTGSNGYYVFQDLTPGQVYNLQTSADRYLDSTVILITATVDPITRDFYMIADLTDTEWWHYVEFTIQNFWGTTYPGVDVTVYEGDSLTEYASGETGTDGTITFHLNQNIEYRLTFISATLGINQEFTVYPISDRYIIYTTTASYTPVKVRTDDIVATVEGIRINATYGYINFTWTDTTAQTSTYNYWINDTDGNVLYTTSGSAINISNSQIVEATNDRYVVHYIVNHPTYGNVEHVETIAFYGGRRVDLGWSEDWHYAVTATLFLFFIAALFGSKHAKYGAVSISTLGWIFMWIGWYDTNSTSLILLILASLVSFGWILRKGEIPGR